MSYVRWSSKVRDNCAGCGDTGRIPDPAEPGETRLCRACCSCWYVFDHIGGYIAVYHADNCPSDGDSGDLLSVQYEDAADWRPPASCPMGDVALEAVAEALADWKPTGGNDA